MEPKKITVAMIDSAVTRGLKEMEDDPKRTTRKLADMGRQFSTGRFQPQIFEIIQTLLENEDSPYYDLLQYFLKHTDHENAKKFGINLGYYSWVYYARKLRERSEQEGFALPWTIDFTYDQHGALQGNSEGYMTLGKIKELMLEAGEFGINTFSINLVGDCVLTNDLFEMFKEFDESAFFLFAGDCKITAAQLNLLKKAGNVMLAVDCSLKDALDTCAALNSCGSLYSIYYRYSNADIEMLQKRAFYDRLSLYPANMLFLIPENEKTVSVGKLVRNIRMEQKCPYFLWVAYGDFKLVTAILCDEQLLFRINSFGKISCPDSSDINIFECTSLEDAFGKLMPKNKD